MLGVFSIFVRLAKMKDVVLGMDIANVVVFVSIAYMKDTC